MRYIPLFALLGTSLAAQDQPNCRDSITRDVDVRCACVKDPGSQQCEMVRKGFYEPHDLTKIKPLDLSSGITYKLPSSRPVLPRSQPIQPRQARVVAMGHKDYLRFLHPQARLVAGFDFERVFRLPEVMSALFGHQDGADGSDQTTAALKEMDRLWLSFVPPADLVILMTGKFERGATAGILYAKGIRPVFLGDAHAMMIGPEPSIQAALARLARPAPEGGWVTSRGRELSKDHETWIVNDMLPPQQDAGPLHALRRFALAFRVTGKLGIDGVGIADSENSGETIAAWVEQMKAAMREKTGAGALDSLTVVRDGATLRFSAAGPSLLSGDSGRTAMNSELGVALYSVVMAGFPGMPSRVVAGDKLVDLKPGMKRDEVLALLGKPLSVSAIQGLDTPRENWTYQVAFGKQFTLTLDGGVVSGPPR